MAKEAAVTEVAPVTEIKSDPPVTPLGEIYTKALAEQGKKEAEPKTEVLPAKEPEVAKVDKVAPSEEKPATKPTNALDAVLEAKPEDKKVESEVDPLKDYPEEPQEGVKRNWKGLRGVAENALKIAATERTEKEKALQNLDIAQKAAKSVDPELTAKLEKALAENAELRDAITGVNLELLPEFRKEFIEGRKELVNAATEKVKAYGGDSEALKAALGMPEGIARDNAIEAAFGEEMTEVRKTNIRNMVSQIEAKDEARAKQMSDPQNSFEAYEAKRAASKTKAEEVAIAHRSDTIKNTVKSLVDQSPLFKPAEDGTDGKEDWDKGLPELNDVVAEALSPKMTLEKATVLAAKGHRFDFVAKKLGEAYGENVQLKKQLAEFDTAQPDAKGQKQPQQSEEEAKLAKTPGQKYVELITKGQNVDL